MSESSPELVVVNLEHTIVDNVSHNTLMDMVEAGVVRPETFADVGQLSIKEQRALLIGWLANKSIAALDPVLDVVYDHTAQRLVPFGRLLIQAHAEAGHSFCLYSATVTQPELEAHADGIEDAIPGAKFSLVYGRELEVEDNTFTGRLYDMPKRDTLAQLERDGHDIHVVFDSFFGALAAVYLGRYQFLVNLHFNRIRPHDNYIEWQATAPAQTSFRLAGEEQPVSYDLSMPEEQQAFLKHYKRAFKSRREHSKKPILPD